MYQPAKERLFVRCCKRLHRHPVVRKCSHSPMRARIHELLEVQKKRGNTGFSVDTH